MCGCARLFLDVLTANHRADRHGTVRRSQFSSSPRRCSDESKFNCIQSTNPGRQFEISSCRQSQVQWTYSVGSTEWRKSKAAKFRGQRFGMGALWSYRSARSELRLRNEFRVPGLWRKRPLWKGATLREAELAVRPVGGVRP